jgi:N-acetylglutamate synthase-like GNAT family acetyltransferase
LQAFSVRPFEASDQLEVERLVLTIQQDEFGYQLTTDNQPDLKDVATFFSDGHSAFWVAQSAEDAIIGCIGLMDLGDGACAMRKFMVAAHARGRANGVSAALTSQFEAHARAYCPVIALATVQKTAAAQAFYIREGYRLVDKAALPNGFVAGPFDVIFMVKDLHDQSI